MSQTKRLHALRVLLPAALLALGPALAGADLHFINDSPDPVRISKPGGPKVRERFVPGRRLLRAGLETAGVARPAPSVGLEPLNNEKALTVASGESAWIHVPEANASRPVHFIEVASPGPGRKVLCALRANHRRASLDLFDGNGVARVTPDDNRFHFTWTEPELVFVPAPDPEQWVFVPEPDLEFVPLAPAATQVTLARARALGDGEMRIPAPDPVFAGQDPVAAGAALAKARARVRARRMDHRAPAGLETVPERGGADPAQAPPAQESVARNQAMLDFYSAL
jgi:hypothetical protein